MTTQREREREAELSCYLQKFLHALCHFASSTLGDSKVTLKLTKLQLEWLKRAYFFPKSSQISSAGLSYIWLFHLFIFSYTQSGVDTHTVTHTVTNAHKLNHLNTCTQVTFH